MIDDPGISPNRKATVVINLEGLTGNALPIQFEVVFPQASVVARDVMFSRSPERDVYTMFHRPGNTGSIPGTLLIRQIRGSDTAPSLQADRFGKEQDLVRVIIDRREEEPAQDTAPPSSPLVSVVGAYTRLNGEWVEASFQAVDPTAEIGSRFAGIFETKALSDSRVFVAGLGSGGAPIAEELAKSMVGHFDLMDHDRIEIGNVTRHLAGLSDIGRRKTDFMRERIREKNPGADVRVWPHRVCWKNGDLVRQIVRDADQTMCAIDDKVGRVILNRFCVEEGKPLLVAGAFRRAYGGQIHFIRPFETPCYQCFLNALPQPANDQEVSSQRQARAIAYSDRPVPIEPGLSTDIAPISNMCAKLIIHELLRGKPTTLKSLEEDLIAPWYIWFNRREPGGQSEKFAPFGFGLDGMRILRWYGISLPRDPGCPVCGNFVEGVAKRMGISITPEDIAEFGKSER